MRARRWGLGLAAVVVLLAWGTGGARAQYQNPPLSPYLNLFQRGGSLTSNYYGLVRPQLEFQAGLNQLQRQIQYAQQNVTVQAIDVGVVTGHVAGFQTQGAYFSGAYYHPYPVVNANLPGTGTSQRPLTTPALNSPGFYNTTSTGLLPPAQQPPASTPTARPPGQ